jgi:hypothetical protein
MEPGQTCEAPRPKGFVRRNWLALFAVLASLNLSFLMSVLYLPPNVLVVVSDGNLWGMFSRIPLPLTGWGDRWEFLHEWKSPHLGGLPNAGRQQREIFSYSISEDFYFLNVPVWLMVGAAMLRIAFREWRQKRAARGGRSA